MKILRLGTRGSQLALYQAHTVADQLLRRGGPPCEIVIISTSGDQLAEAPLSEVGGKRLFVKEIEEALLAGAIDLAVHSSKDMPAILPEGLEIGAVLCREDPSDALVLPGSSTVQLRTIDELIAALGQSPRVGTSSVRRVAQLNRLWPAARFEPIRGNLDTRLRKLDSGEYDVLVLAAAGLKRLGVAHRISLLLPTAACVPAPGQGAIAVEIRSRSADLRRGIEPLNDLPTAAAVESERALVAALGGGCQMPLGAIGVPAGDELDLHAVVLSLDGSRALRQQRRGLQSEARQLGERVAADLARDGAVELLDEVRRTLAPVEGIQP